MKVIVHDKLSDIPESAWNELVGRRYPFLRHEFLRAAEDHGCTAPENGWTPRHLAIFEGSDLRAAMPLYEKSHSWGEFVFDWAWANAYEQAGLSYYPKLVSAIPFTPAPSSRLLLRDSQDEEAAAGLVQASITLAEELDFSSVHFLFPCAEDMPHFEKAGLLIRKDCQFHWSNDNYSSFDDFLATFTAVKRKKVRRERRRMKENNICFRHIKGAEMDAAAWATTYRLISQTFAVRGSAPYFSQAFFEESSARLPDNFLVILAEVDEIAVAAAIFYESETHLYGRYWGCEGHHDSLHFETCYYQGIDYCIANDLKVFEPGTQGEHKISRGFSPVSTWSAHWLAHPQFSSAIEQYLDEEGRHVDRYMDAVDAHTPYKKTV